MNAPSPPFSSADPFPRQTNPAGGEWSQAPPRAQRSRNRWLALRQWFQSNTFAPQWLPDPLRHPLIGYLVALLLEVAAATILLLLVFVFPSFAFHGVLTDVAVILLALGWGAGPGLFATLVGTVLLYYAVLPPHFAWSLANPADSLGLVMYLVVGVSVSVLASRSEGARRHAEQAEASSRADAQRLRTVLEVLPAGVAIADRAGRLVEVNPALRTIWGEHLPLVSDRTQYGTYRGWWAKTDQPLAAEDWAMARALTRGEVSVNEEIEIETFAGQRKVILNSAAPLRDETGAIMGGVVSEQDITEVRRLEREVAERAAELEAIFESMTDAVFVFDAAGHIRRVNALAREILGPEQSRWQDRSMQERFAYLLPRDQDAQVVPFEHLPAQRVLRGEVLTGAQAVDLLYLRAEGRTLVTSFSGTPLRDSTGAITGAVLVARDVTERQRLERQTREALSALVQMAEVLVQQGIPTDRWASENQSEVGRVAHQLAELTRAVLGCERVSVIAFAETSGHLRPLALAGFPSAAEAGWFQALPQFSVPRYFPAPLHQRLEAGEVLVQERPALEQPPRSASGGKQTLIAPMRLGQHLLGILRLDYGSTPHRASPTDQALAGAVAKLAALVLERERLFGEREEARASALAEREANHQMDTFLSMVSHELKQPLTVQRGQLQLAHRRVERLTTLPGVLPPPELAVRLAPLKEQLASMDRQMHRQDALINDLLDAARIRTGTLAIQPERVNLLPLVQRAVEEQRQLAPERELWLDLPTVEDLPVLADARRLEQVVTNYLTNALKYSPASCPVEVGVTREETQVRVWVRDQGPGLAPDQQQRIYERFYRAPGIQVQSGVGIGLGLGLYICRTLIEQQGGQVGVESTPGQGSTFWFTLPVRPPAQDAHGRR